MTLADVTGGIEQFSPADLSRFERGQQGISTDKLAAVAEALSIPLSDLYAMAEDRVAWNARHVTVDRVPLISYVQAGQWREIIMTAQPSEIEWVPTTARVSSNAFALRIIGDSMEPMLPEGSMVIVDPDATPENGKIVVVRQNGNDATIKKLVIDGGKRYLQPINPRYPVLEAKEDAEFCGVVRQIVMDL